MRNSSDFTKGLAAAISCYILWGLVPIFWKWLGHIPAFELINHRIIWSSFILLIVVAFQRRLKSFINGFLSWKSFLTLLATTILISLNWFIFIWAVHEGHILDTSLGYYINPLVNIVLGSVILKEKQSRLQKIAVVTAGTGVLYLVLSVGYFPWVALVLAISFALYSFIRKIAPVDPVLGLAQEATLLVPLSLFYLGTLQVDGKSAFGQTLFDSFMLVMCGVVTLVPLLLFLFSLKKIKLSTVGILQFITPTTTFLLAVFYYREPFDMTKLIAFSFIWIAVILYVSDLRAKTQKAA